MEDYKEIEKKWAPVQCPIWDLGAYRNPSVVGDYNEYYSKRAGGRFKISGSAQGMLKSVNRSRISTEILKLNLNGQIPFFYTTDIERMNKILPLGIVERYNLILRTMGAGFGNLESSIVVEDLVPSDGLSRIFASLEWDEPLPSGYNASDALVGFLHHAKEKGIVRGDVNSFISFTVSGLEYLENLGFQYNDSNQIFVAMWFGNERLHGFYKEVIRPAIESTGYNCMRIDNSEHNEKIDDQIIAEIRKSKAVIVDITCGLSKPVDWSEAELVGSPRGGVFYEAGFAKGLGLPVIWMVDNDIAEKENVSHFDIRQYNQIRWTDDFAEAKERLQNRIEATLGVGEKLK